MQGHARTQAADAGDFEFKTKRQAASKDVQGPIPGALEAADVIKTLLGSQSVADLIAARDYVSKEVVTVRTHETLEHFLKTIGRVKCRSLPVLNADNVAVGFVDVLDVSRFLLANSPDPEKLQHQELESLQIAGKKLLHTPVSALLNFSGRDPLLPVFSGTKAIDACNLFAQGIHRLAVFSDAPDIAATDSKRMLVGVCSQSDVVRFLEGNMDKLADSALLAQTVGKLGVGTVLEERAPGAVLHISHTATVAQAVHKLALTGTAALAIVDKNSGKLVGNFSASDLRACFRARQSEKERTISLFLERVGDFLNEFHPESLKPVAVNFETTLMNVIQTMGSKRMHHLWLINQEQQPVGIITLTDVLRAIMRA